MLCQLGVLNVIFNLDRYIQFKILLKILLKILKHEKKEIFIPSKVTRIITFT